MLHRPVEAGGHGFLNKWHPRYHQAAAEESWAKALEFLHAHLYKSKKKNQPEPGNVQYLMEHDQGQPGREGERAFHKAKLP